MIRSLRNLFIYAIVIIFSLEVVFYFGDIPKEYKPLSYPFQFQNHLDKEIGWTNLRSASIDFVYDGNTRGYFKKNNTVNHITNSAGYRGAEIPLKKAKDALRILFLGDSWTFGVGVYLEDTYPELFKIFGQQKNIFNKNIESINLAVCGYNTQQEYTILRKASELNPDRVIVGYFLNDAREPIFKLGGDVKFDYNIIEEESFVLASQKMPVFFKYFRTFRIIRSWYLSKVISNKTTNYYRSLYKDDNPSWLKTKEAIKNFGKYQKQNNTPVTFVLFPVLFRLDEYPFLAEHQKIKYELERNNIEYVDLLPLLSKYKAYELWIHPTDNHPNEIVHRIAAEALVGKLSKE